jgi:hypothetical protein
MVDRISHTPPPGYKSGDDPAWQNLFNDLSGCLYDPSQQGTAKGMLEGLQNLVWKNTGPFASALTQLQNDLNGGASTSQLKADFAKLTQAQIPQFSVKDWQFGTGQTLDKLLGGNDHSSQEASGLFKVLQFDREASGSALGSQFASEYDGRFTAAFNYFQTNPNPDSQDQLHYTLEMLRDDIPS